MLVEFRFSNYRSFAEETVLSMRTGKIAGDLGATIEASSLGKGERVLRSAVVFGANASGKTNLLRALSFVQEFVEHSARIEASRVGNGGEDAPIRIEPFALSPDLSAGPSTFEVTFIREDVLYTYGFEITPSRVNSEWLSAFPHRRERKLFRRTWNEAEGKSEWDFGPNLEGPRQSIRELTRDDTLFLSVAAAANHPQMALVYSWFRDIIRATDYERESSIRAIHAYTEERFLEDEKFRQWTAARVKTADVGIESITARRGKIVDIEFGDDIPPDVRDEVLKKQKGQEITQILCEHKGPQGCSGTLELEHESAGTRKFLDVLGPWEDVLSNGRILVIDELSARLHPLLTRHLIQMFHSNETNPKGAQLIFATHDVSLLDPSLFRRDQVWFTEKDDEGVSELVPLLDYKPREQEALLRGYLAGRYGAIPRIAD